MSFIEPKDAVKIKELLDNMKNVVEIKYFSSQLHKKASERCAEILGELAGLSDKLAVVSGDYDHDREEVDRLLIIHAPAITLQAGGREYGFCYYGVPETYEFIGLVNVIEMVGKDDSDLVDEDRQDLRAVDLPVEIKVFVSENCPNCPWAVMAAGAVAVETPKIRVSVFEIERFPEMVSQYDIRSVPKTIVGDYADFTGRRSANELVGWVIEDYQEKTGKSEG
jgi:glutaredoxin-like protein